MTTKLNKSIAFMMLMALLPGVIMGSTPKSSMTASTSKGRTIPPKKQSSSHDVTLETKKNFGMDTPLMDNTTMTDKAQLTTAQKLAVQARNALGKTGVSNKGIIDYMAGTKDFKLSDGTLNVRSMKVVQATPVFDMHEGIPMADAIPVKGTLVDAPDLLVNPSKLGFKSDDTILAKEAWELKAEKPEIAQPSISARAQRLKNAETQLNSIIEGSNNAFSSLKNVDNTIAVQAYLKSQKPSQLVEFLFTAPGRHSEMNPISRPRVWEAITSNLADVTGITAVKQAYNNSAAGQAINSRTSAIMNWGGRQVDALIQAGKATPVAINNVISSVGRQLKELGAKFKKENDTSATETPSEGFGEETYDLSNQDQDYFEI